MKKQFRRRRRSNTYIYTKITVSLPFIEVDLNLTPKQMSMFINGLQYIIPCQSRFSRKSINDIITAQYQKISTIVKSCLKDNHMLITDTRAKKHFRISVLSPILIFANSIIANCERPQELRQLAKY